MQFDEVLRTFASFFERERIAYAITGDLALHVCGHPHVRPRLELLVDPVARTRVTAFATAIGFRALREAPRVAIYSRETADVIAFIFANPSRALPGFWFDERFLPILDPRHRLPLDERDLAALELATMHMESDDSAAWLMFMMSVGPPSRTNSDTDEPFTL